MAGFIRRTNQFPSIETLTEIESVTIIDAPPPFPTTGIGTGTVLVVGEFEDGPFAAGGDAEYWDTSKGLGPQEVYSPQDYKNKFGAFGFMYGSTPSTSNPCARKHLAELWNGNGFLKTYGLAFKRLVLARVDTSVGQVAFSPLAFIEGGTGPFNLEPGQVFTVTTDQGGPVSTAALTAVRATSAGASGVFPTEFVGGEQIGITIDNGAETIVTFSAADQTAANVVARINASIGGTNAILNSGQVDIVGIIRGTGGKVVLRDVTTGALAVIGHTAGTTAGTGMVANVDAVTASEVAARINATSAITSVGGGAVVTPEGRLRVYSTTPGTGTVNITSTPLSSAAGITPTGTTVSAGTHAAGTIPAGTRVRAGGGAEWVTMQTLTIPEGTSATPVPGPFVVKVRPALDDGTAASANAEAITIVVDQPAFAALSVVNAAGFTAAKDEPQMDALYGIAIDTTATPNGVTREVTEIISARGSDTLRLKLKTNAIDASNQGCFGRKTTVSAPLGFTSSQAINQVALTRSERVNYTWPGVQITVPEIAIVGTAGGLGFTKDGVITVRADGPLASINSQIPPEENPGQATGLLERYFKLEAVPETLNEALYKALKRAGICAPRIDRVSGTIFQSGITSSLTEGLKNQARRKMADFIQDTLADRFVPLTKKPNTIDRRDSMRAISEQFLSSLKSEDNPGLQRIADYSVDEKSGNTPSTEAQGIYVQIIRVRTLSSLDYIVLQTEIGEAVQITQQAA